MRRRGRGMSTSEPTDRKSVRPVDTTKMRSLSIRNPAVLPAAKHAGAKWTLKKARNGKWSVQIASLQ